MVATSPHPLFVLDQMPPATTPSGFGDQLLVLDTRRPRTQVIWHCRPLTALDGEPTWEDAEWQ